MTSSDSPWQQLRAWLESVELPPTPPHPCSYLPGLLASERAFRADTLDPEAYHELMDRGFRRSGSTFYAMACADCRRCVPIRVPVAEFAPSRSQRRAQRRNQDVRVHIGRPEFTAATWDLYRRYGQAQHGKRDEDDSPEGLRDSLYAPVVDTYEVTYRLGDRAIGKSLLDVCSRSVSAVYHFYDPDHARRSIGVFSVLAEIAWTRQIGVPHYYLGFWIEGAKTMQYKADYRPHELLIDGTWRRVDAVPRAC